MNKEINSKIRILIVEDEPIQSRLVSIAMESEGYRVESADTAKLALDKINQQTPHIIILDMNLPDMTGLEIIEKLGNYIKSELMKIVVYSSDDDNSIVLKALSIGATDYAFKKDDLKILQARVANVAKTITLNRKLNKNIRVLEEGMSLAREIQLSITPSVNIQKDPNLYFNILYLPADYVSGDIYDICKLSDKKYRVFLADATGHGIQAGFITMSIKTEYDHLKKMKTDICYVINKLNQAVFETFSTLTIYTCFIADIDLESMTLTYTSSGHPAQMLLQNDSIQELPTTNPIIGFVQNLVVQKKTVPLDPNFKLFLFSDGIYEFIDFNNELFGIDRFKDFLWKIKNSDIEDSSYHVLNNIIENSNTDGFSDDVTLLAISQKH